VQEYKTGYMYRKELEPISPPLDVPFVQSMFGAIT
jgi:hypothetical protein